MSYRPPLKSTASTIRSINRQNNTPHVVFSIIIGTFLTVMSFLAIPGIFLSGYFLKLLKESKSSSSTQTIYLPHFSGWIRLIRDGISAYLIYGVYAAIPLLIHYIAISNLIQLQPRSMNELILTSMGLSGIGLIGGFPVALGVGSFGPLVFNWMLDSFSVFHSLSESSSIYLLLISTILLLIAMYLLPAALLNFIDSSSLLSAFKFRTILRDSLDPQYARKCLQAIFVATVGWLFAFAGLIIDYYEIFPGSKFSVLSFVNPEIPIVTISGILFFGYVIISSLIYFSSLVYSFNLITQIDL